MKRLTIMVLSLSLVSAIPCIMGQSQVMSAKDSQKIEAQVVRLAKLEIDPAQLESYKAALTRKSKSLFASSQEFWAYTLCRKKIIRPTSSFLKCMLMRMSTRHTWKRPISKFCSI